VKIWIILALAGAMTPAAVTAIPATPAYDDYAAVLSAYVSDDGLVDYAGLAAHPERLDAFLASTADMTRDRYESWDKPDRMAYWLNAYNALTLKTIADHYPIRPAPGRTSYPPNSIRQIPGVWDGVRFTVMRLTMTLNAIEHDILRKEFDDPRIHVALVCGAMSCPPLRREPYRGASLDQQLDDQARRFVGDLRSFLVDREKGEVWASSIFQWYAEDFLHGKILLDPKHPEATTRPMIEKAAVLAFVPKYVSEADADYLRTGSYRLLFFDYDWSLNERTK
jgi:hypothetical protein